MPGAPATTPRKQLIIAIVDDDASVCRALERLVRSLGFEGATFSGGQHFLDALSGPVPILPDCAVLDIHMPGMTGIELQQRLAGTGLPIVFITAHDDPVLRKQALTAGAKAFLRKPFDDELFVETLYAALSRPRDP
ncbi:MAG TPA: response regulator [Burkholderiales bacterium]|nr:response regulator [Burkholderiales bacterium]